jgi:hypothetical protein
MMEDRGCALVIAHPCRPGPTRRHCPALACRACVPDPRRAQGRRHLVVFVLALAACVVLAGANSPVAIAEWAADAPPGLLARLGGTVREPDSGPAAPAEATVRRVLQRIDGDALDGATGAWLVDRAHTADPQPGERRRARTMVLSGMWNWRRVQATSRSAEARQARESCGRRTASRPGAWAPGRFLGSVRRHLAHRLITSPRPDGPRRDRLGTAAGRSCRARLAIPSRRRRTPRPRRPGRCHGPGPEGHR